MRKAMLLLVLFLVLCGCGPREAPKTPATENVHAGLQAEYITIDRESKIPADAVKMTPETDKAPVKSYSDEFYDPEPLPYPINTKGAEDSSFALPDGNTLYVFFTPDVKVPIQGQVADGVTGIYVHRKVDREWTGAERVWLQDPGKLSLDGCLYVNNDDAWFCSAREGYTGLHWVRARMVDGTWTDWEVDDFNPAYEVGELHITSDGSRLYYHSNREGGLGGLDIWMSENIDGEWQEPVNVAAVNTERDEGWPALNPQEDELWISRDYGLWRSRLVRGEWQEPELMFSPLAGEATIDASGNVYFTHHFFDGDEMIEADIYMAQRK